jgi:spore germination protein GerM
VRRSAALAIALLAIAGCKKTQPLTSQNLNVANKVAPRIVLLYYESPDMLLVPEQRSVELPQNPAGALSYVARELMKGSTNAGVPKLFPADTVVRGAYLLPDGTAFVDLGGATLEAGWGTGSHEELMAVYSVVQTVMSNFPEVKRVRLLVNGEPAETLAGHISLARPLTPNRALLPPAAAR